jgi:DnaK suppressor protein
VANDIDTRAVQEVLHRHREELQAQMARLTKAPERGSGISFGKRVGDGTTEAVSRLNDVSVVDNLSASVEQVERALERLEDGHYGECEHCGRPIPPARLQARPESTLCVECAGGHRRG